MSSPVPILQAMQFDPATLLTAAAGALLMFALVSIVARMRDRRLIDHLLWSGTFLLAALGFVLLLVAPAESRAIGRVCSNILFLLAYGMGHAAARRMAGRAPQPGVAVAGGAIWAVLSWGIDIDPALRMPIASAIIALYAFGIAAEFRRGADPDEPARRIAMWLCVAHGGFYVGRALFGPHFGLGIRWNENALSLWGAIMAFEAILFAGALAMLVFAMARERAGLAARRLAATDALTGIANRRDFNSVAPAILADEKAAPVVLLLLDVDGFKAVNDRHGHEAGDQLLIGLVAIIAAELDEPDYFWRLGGDEFAILLRASDRASGRALAERVRQRVAMHGGWGDRSGIRVSVTLGIAVHEPGMTLDKLVRHADLALYRGKAQGRNRTFEHDPHIASRAA